MEALKVGALMLLTLCGMLLMGAGVFGLILCAVGNGPQYVPACMTGMGIGMCATLIGGLQL